MPQITTELEAYLMAVLNNVNGTLDVDWAGVMADTGLRSLGGASNKLRFAKTQYAKQKADGTLPTGGAAVKPSTAGPVTPKKTSKRKAEDADAEEEMNINTADKPKAAKAAKAVKK